jgi:adenylate kinase family enzyme
MARIQLIGGSGSGKTSLGLTLAARLRAPFVDLDDLYWEPGWREVGHDELKRRVAPIAAQDAWVIAGNYGATAEVLLWPRLTQLVVLDLPYRAMLWRILRRSLLRIVHREPCCNGNRDSLLRLFHRDARCATSRVPGVAAVRAMPRWLRSLRCSTCMSCT